MMEPRLIRNVCVAQPASPHHGQRVDVRLVGNTLAEVAAPATLPGEPHFDGNGDWYLSPGFVDAFAHLTDPGHENRDTLATLADSAAAGGFAELVFLPHSSPVVDNADQLLALQHRSAHLPVRFHFMGTLTAEAAGKQMAPLFELHQAGAKAFHDGDFAPGNPSLLVLLLSYLRLFNGLAVVQPLESNLTGAGIANESEATTRLGLKPIPPLAEELAIATCLQVLAHTGGRLHFAPITTAGSVKQVREAKAQGLNVTASTAPQYLWLEDSALESFDPNYKVLPPLRTPPDREALLFGLLDGSLDFVASHHNPQAVEDKVLEFQQSSFGMLGMETCVGVLGNVLHGAGINAAEWMPKWLSEGARHVLGLPLPKVEVGGKGPFTLFNPHLSFEVTASVIKSKSCNSPFLGQLLRGKALVA